MQRSNVVFPAPEGPTMLKISWSLTVTLTSSKMTREPKLFFKFLTSNIGLPPVIYMNIVVRLCVRYT